MSAALGWFLIVHAILTGAVWAAPLLPDAPFDPAQSWLLGASRHLAVPAAILVALALFATGLGVLLGQAWWPSAGLVAGVAGTLLVVTYFNPWLSLAVAINAGLAVLAATNLSAG